MQEHIAPEAKSRKKLGIQRGAERGWRTFLLGETDACRRERVWNGENSRQNENVERVGNGFPRGYRVERAKGMQKRGGEERHVAFPPLCFDPWLRVVYCRHAIKEVETGTVG